MMGQAQFAKTFVAFKFSNIFSNFEDLEKRFLSKHVLFVCVDASSLRVLSFRLLKKEGSSTARPFWRYPKADKDKAHLGCGA